MIKEMTKATKKILFISPIVYVLTFGFLIRLILGNFGTLRLDQGTFIAWSDILVKGGLSGFYNGWSDYLPGYLYFLWVLGKIRGAIPIPDDLLYKIPAIIFDVATAGLIYEITKKIKNVKAGIFAASIYIFNPAVLANSTLWGQVDSLTAFFVVAAIWLIERNFLISAISLAIGTLIKPQAAFVFPVVVFLFLKQGRKFRELLIYCVTGLLVFVAGFVPFAGGKFLPQFIYERLGISLNQYPYTSVNAFNFWGLTGFWKPDTSLTQIAGYLVVLFVFAFLAVKLWKKERGYAFAAVVLSASFIFMTRMHERHLLPALAPLAIGVAENSLLIIPYIGFSLVYVLNLLYSYKWITQNFISIYPPLVIKFIILINLVSFTSFIWTLLDTKRIEKIIFSIRNFFERGRRKFAPNFSKIRLSDKKARVILGIILAFAFVTRVFDLGSPKTMYFDEVYHAFTAKIILSGEAAKAWEWWNTPPSGFAYEWTHPPLAKLGMAAGMLIFGQNSFGWRIPGAILGTLAVFMVYLIAKELFKDNLVSLLSAGVFSLDGLALVMSRIGMNDSYILFFSLLSIYLFMKNRDFWSAASFGLAISSKWSAIWAIPILGILWLWRNKKFSPSILWFLVLPILIYLLTYTQMFLTGHDLTTWWGMQEQMWWYHTGLKATHPYTSPWWEWPFLIRPIYLYTSDEVGGTVARIYAFGNPFVFWFGLASIVLSTIYAYFERNKKLGLVVFSYLVFFVPWALSPRIMFLYHYLPSIPFMSIATAYVLRRNPKLIFAYFLVCLLVFIYFYPHWTGLRIPLSLDASYYWVPSWR